MAKLKTFWKYFTIYEKCYISITLAAAITLAILFPEEDGALILAFTLIAVVGNVICEVLIAKQSRWNFMVSVILVEIFEAAIFFMLAYYASAFITLFFWFPIGIISFIYWTKHKDKMEKQLTKVRKLKPWQVVVTLSGIAVFALTVGYLLQYVGGEDTYLDAVTAAVGIANGVFLLLRFREQWIAWYTYTILTGVLWIISGQWIMLILAIGFLVNTTYGYIKWTIYIRKQKKEQLLESQEPQTVIQS
ncbi:MAG: nicotinamide riboside transporter PnuC [Firmicutes bacterium]|nr:nicotinamide riboside transporter PnuC [Bacillota bacterium]MCL2771649.1 nicotinamide riboside transporter PnuC [Bacillota bacterium]